MSELFNPGAYITPKNIRPATAGELAIVNVMELMARCDDDMVQVHVKTIQTILDDLDAVNEYCIRELTVIDAKDTVDRFADERRAETTAAIAYAETLRRK